MTDATAAESKPPQEVDAKTLRRAVGASAIGNATEWFDYGLYAYGTAYITANLIPGENVLITLGIFAVSFLIRPLGGLVWGPLGDRLGRKQVLAITILMMSGATLCLGLLPTFETIGYAAPLLLILLRLIQGFSTGGEYGGAATFMAEYAPDKRRGFFGSFLEFGTLGGFSLGALLMLLAQLVLGQEAMMAWGWRIPFLVAAPLGLIGLYLRSRMEDTPVFQELEETGQKETETRTQFRDMFLGYWRPILQLFGLVIALNVVNYTLIAYTPTYLQESIGLDENGALIVPIIGQLAMMIFLPFAGALSDRVGRKPMWWASLIGLFVMATPMYMLMGTNAVGAVIGFAVIGLLYVPQLATISATFPAMFPTHIRFAALAIAYNVATSLFGGTAPAINEALIGATGNSLFPAFYMMAACAVGAVALISVIETKGASLRGRGVPGVISRPAGRRPGPRGPVPEPDAS
ncbi:MFS transporter [Microlunatus speluncae]|uniref:MFS transporter n=1 Tax=Microlunatus speluncae TaxID=2594267 RepID=UPI0012665626|nr:MFS transporter [Microlunatus speluncae]